MEAAFKSKWNIGLKSSPNSCPKKPKIWTLLPPIWIVLSSQARLSWLYSVREVQMASKKYLSHHSGLFWAKHAPNSEMKIVKSIIAWKNRFFWPCEGCQDSCSFFSFHCIRDNFFWCSLNNGTLSIFWTDLSKGERPLLKHQPMKYRTLNWGQTTTPGTTSPTLFDKCMRSLTSPANLLTM